MSKRDRPSPTGNAIRPWLSWGGRWLGAIATASFLCACPWRSYEQILAVHLEVLSSMTTKLLETSEAGGRPSAADVAELLYPLRRARQFAYQYRGYSERSSYRELEGALDAYEKLVEEVDAARSDDQRWAAMRDGVLTSADGVREQLQRTQMALERET